MPRGFSHSGRGGGSSGGSRGGGFSGGGGYRSGSSHRGGGGYSPRPRRPLIIPMFGRTVVVSTAAQTLLSFLLIALLLSGFFFFSFIGNKNDVIDERKLLNKDIAYMEELDAKYAEIIRKAELNIEGDDYYIYDDGWYDKANIKYQYGDDPQQSGVYYVGKRNNQNWYFIVYYYDNNDKTDSTFTTFTLNDVNDFNGHLEIACWNDHGRIWAIDTGYTLANNMDYWFMKDDLEELKKYEKTVNWILVGSGLVFAGCIAGLVFVIVKNYKKAKKTEAVQDQKDAAAVAEAQARAEIAQKEASQKARVCEYCGADVPDGDETCPACGSRQFK